MAVWAGCSCVGQTRLGYGPVVSDLSGSSIHFNYPKSPSTRPVEVQITIKVNIARG